MVPGHYERSRRPLSLFPRSGIFIFKNVTAMLFGYQFGVWLIVCSRNWSFKNSTTEKCTGFNGDNVSVIPNKSVCRAVITAAEKRRLLATCRVEV